METAICPNCKGKYKRHRWQRTNGRKKYCSKKCYYEFQTGSIRLSMRRRSKKECVVCLKPYEVGGRAGNNQWFCSRKCQGVGRIHEAKINILSESERGYIAGMLDGEGSIIFPNMNHQRTSVRFVICNTKKNIIIAIQKMVNKNVGTIVIKKHDNLKWKTIYYYQIYSWNAIALLKQILPMMQHPEKIRRAKKIIKEYDGLRAMVSESI